MDHTTTVSTPTTPTPPRSPTTPTSPASTSTSPATRDRTTTTTAKITPASDRFRRRLLAEPEPPPDGIHQSLGPLRKAAPGPETPTKTTPAAPAGATLRDQGVLGLQLRQQGNATEVRLQLRQGGGVVEASLRETTRGVEIQLTAGPDQQPLLRRVAETLAGQRKDQAFDLDEITVDSQGDPTHSRRQTPNRQTPNHDQNDGQYDDQYDGQFDAPGLIASTPRRRRQIPAQLGSAHPLKIASAGTSYAR